METALAVLMLQHAVHAIMHVTDDLHANACSSGSHLTASSLCWGSVQAVSVISSDASAPTMITFLWMMFSS